MAHATQWPLALLGQHALSLKVAQAQSGTVNLMSGEAPITYYQHNMLLLYHRITDITTASPAGLTKSSLRSGPGTNQWYIDVTWSPSASQTGPNIFCYYAQDSIG